MAYRVAAALSQGVPTMTSAPWCLVIPASSRLWLMRPGLSRGFVSTFFSLWSGVELHKPPAICIRAYHAWFTIQAARNVPRLCLSHRLGSHARRASSHISHSRSTRSHAHNPSLPDAASCTLPLHTVVSPLNHVLDLLEDHRLEERR
jgi:hypothetical protein